MSWNPIGDLKKLAAKIANGVDETAHRAMHAVETAASTAEHKIESAASSAEHKIAQAGLSAKHEIESLDRDVVQHVREVESEAVAGAKKAFEEVVEAVVAAAASGALSKALDIARMGAPSGLTLTLGPVCFSVDDLQDRIDVLQRWSHQPPTGHHDIRKMIEEFAPSSVSVSADIQFALLVVSSEALEIGFAVQWETSDFLDQLEKVIGEF